MPRKKVTEVAGNGGIKRKRGGGRRKDRDFSSDDEFDDFEQENTKKPGKPTTKSGLQPVTVADDVKEKIKLECSKVKGQLLIFGATNWDLIGRKEVPKQQEPLQRSLCGEPRVDGSEGICGKRRLWSDGINGGLIMERCAVTSRSMGQRSLASGEENLSRCQSGPIGTLGRTSGGPHRYGCLSGVQVSTVVSGPCAAHSLLITTEGKLWSWGRNEKGQLGHGDTKRIEAPKLIEALGEEVIVAAACGRNHTLALTENGTAYSFGENKLGQLGHGNQTDAVPTPATIQYNGQPLVKVACGAEFSMVVDCKGNLYSFGCPEYGQLGHNSDGKFIARAQRIEFDCELIPRRVAIFIEKTKDSQVLPVPNVVVRDVACGGEPHAGAGLPEEGVLLGFRGLFDFPGRGASQIYSGYQCSFAVSEMGGLFFWGVTNTSRESTMYPKAVQDLCGWKIRSLACGKSSIIIAADDSTISWGPSPTSGELGYGDNKPKSSTTAQEVKTLDGIYSEQVVMGYAHSLIIARQETEQEQEKLKKLPEYNPRML
ncbi:hypothetical protein SKAU_G00109850 [Synaphobranchus kaupii]|uniref:RCC1-like domain-containing protein n=1 Tax=Synaphobranchus kaupii TaxID=118154 RepID=A0A9Q1G0V7_SYNKA|nr:hypothetical protein SKAU_G00109850 [Synaphobranchus kaupii]